MRGAHRRRVLAGREKDSRLPECIREACLEQRRIDSLALAGLQAMNVGGEYRVAGIYPGIQIGDRHADLDRRPARVSGYADHSTHRLSDEVKAASVTIGTRLSKAGDRAINKRGVSDRERIVAQAQTVHRSGT